MSSRVVNTCNSSYMGSRGGRILSSRPARAKLVKAEDIAQVVQRMPSKWKALTEFNPQYCQKIKTKQNKNLSVGS
jgi:hypothetical protein